MTIKRTINGQEIEIELTANELSLAYEEAKRQTWRDMVGYWIEDHAVEFTDEITREDFIAECMDLADNRYYAENPTDEYVAEICEDTCGYYDLMYEEV